MTLDTPPQRRLPPRWMIACTALVVVGLVLIGLRLFRQGDPADTDGMSPQLRAQLAARLAAQLQKSIPEDDFPDGVEEIGTVLCAVDPFGVEPSSARTIAQVRTVYALHLCAIAERGTPWDGSTRLSGPLAADLVGPDDVRIRVAKPGAGYPDHVRAIIPARYQRRATGPFLDRQALAQLRERFNAVAG